MDESPPALPLLLFAPVNIVLDMILSTRHGPPGPPAAALGNGVVLAPASPRHVPEMCEVFAASFGRRPPRRTLHRLVRLFPQTCVVAVGEGSVIGYAIGRLRLRPFMEPRRGRSVFLASVAVRREFQGQGIGKALVTRIAETSGSLLNAGEFCLEVRRSNAVAIALYRSLGLEIVAEGGPFRRESVFMARRLRTR